MPILNGKSPATAAPAKVTRSEMPPPPEPTPTEVIYERVECQIRCEGYDGAITVDEMKQILGWETESEYVARMVAQGHRAEACKWKESSEDPNDVPVLMKDVNGERVKCWHNAHNRPFDEQHAKKLAQDILDRNWAGPTTMPGETVNGESLIISRTGQVTSGQHRGVGLILADQFRAQNPLEYEGKWPAPPVLETVLVLGVSDSPQVIRTIDNVKPRVLTDVFYTSDTFSKLGTSARRECCRMLARAVDFLWRRTGIANDTFQTHSESLEFVKRHMRVIKSVEWIFECNDERGLSNLKLSPGMCAGALYLMATSASDRKKYEHDDPAQEKSLDFQHWGEAREFWRLLGGTSGLKAVHEAIGALATEDGVQGRAVEKFIVVAKAWPLFLAKKSFTAADVRPETKADRNGVFKIVDRIGFGGVDLGPPEGQDEEELRAPSPADIEAAKAQIRRENAEAAIDRVKREPSQTVAEPGQGKPPSPKLLDKPLHKRDDAPPAAKKSPPVPKRKEVSRK